MENEFNAFFKSKSNHKSKPEKKDLASEFENEMNQEIINVIKTNQEKTMAIIKNENKPVEMVSESGTSKKTEILKHEKVVEDEEDTDSEAELETGFEKFYLFHF
jgi:hypothetical protein